MRKQLLNLKFLLMLCMIFGIGGGSVAFAGEGDVFYTLTTPQNTSNTAYATYYDVTINGLKWSAPGNHNFDGYWRIGGKSLTKVDRSITGKSQIGSVIGKVTLNHNGKSNASLTINSISLTVASDALFTNIIETVTKTSPSIAVSTAGSIDFEPTGDDWAENSYYKLTINCSNSTKSNYGFDFTSLVFYEGTTSSTPSTNYSVTWMVNGEPYTTGDPSTEVAEGKKVTTLPTAPEAINGKVFVGWTNAEIASSQDEAPLVLFTTAESAPDVTDNTTYYAVFATQSGSAPAETLSQTLQYDTWTYSGSTTDKTSYRLFHTDSYIESAEFDLSTLSKVVVYGGTFGGTGNNKLNIGDGTNTWKDVTVSGSSQTGVNTYTDGNALSGTGKLRITSKSGTASSTGVRISKVEIYTTTGGYTYSDYVTSMTVATLTGISVTGTATDLWKGDEFTHEGITVTATYDDETTADVTNSCTYSNYDMSTAGEQTVTVTYGGQSASYKVTVKTIGNTKETAYTATEAIAIIDAGKDLNTPVFVKGTVSSIAQAWTSANGYLSFWVSEDGTDNKFEMYRNYKGEGKVKYDSAGECPAVGDEVICCGLLYKYNSTYELNDGNYLVEKIVTTSPSEPTYGELTFKAQNSDGYYATFSSDKDVVFTADDVIVYAISVAENKMTWNGLPSTENYAVTDATAGTVTGYYVPKNNGVLIYSTEASAKYYFPKTEDRNVTIENNNLKAAPAAGGVLTPEKGDYKYYKLAYDDYDKKTGLGFYWGAENGGAFSVKAGSAYLAVPTSAANVKGFSFDGTTTGISAVGAEGTAKTNEIYNIAGQRVNAMTKAGLYIVNGKKMVIKK